MFLSRRFCAALPHATALPNSSLHTPLCEIYFACFAVGRISSSPPTPETLLFSRVSCFCQGDFVRRCRTQLRCRTLRCTLRFAKSISLASLLGESLLLRHEMQSCLTRRVAFLFAHMRSMGRIACGGRRPAEQRDVRCLQRLTSSSRKRNRACTGLRVNKKQTCLV